MYIITNTSSDTTLFVPDNSINNDVAVKLPGRNTPNYGEAQNENFVRMLENFANQTPPPVPDYLNGQLWYDTSPGNELFRVWDGAAWTFATRVKITNTPPNNSISRDGNLYYDSGTNKIKILKDSTWIDASYSGEISDAFSGENSVGNPTQYGTRIRTIILEDLSQTPRPVLAVMYAHNGSTVAGVPTGSTSTRHGRERIQMIISEHPEFEVLNTITENQGEQINWYADLTSTGGIGNIIRKGVNLRCDSAQSPTPGYHSRSQRSDQSFALNTGVFQTGTNCLPANSTGAEIIQAANVAHNLADFVPQVNNSIDLGSVSNWFANVFVNDIWLGNALLPLNGNVSLGTDNNPIKYIYVTELEVDGNLIIEGDNVTIGTPVQPVSVGYFQDLFVNNTLTLGNVSNNTSYSFPSVGEPNSLLITDANRDFQWYDSTEMVSGAQGGNGIDVVETIAVVNNANTKELEISIRGGQGVTFDVDGNLTLDLSDFSTTDLPEGNNLYFTTSRSRSALSAGPGITYNPTTGVIGVVGGGTISSIAAGNGLTGSTVDTSVTLNVNPGTGISIVSDQVRTDNTWLRNNLYSGGSNSSGEVQIDASGTIRINDVNATRLGGKTSGQYVDKVTTSQQDIQGPFKIQTLRLYQDGGFNYIDPQGSQNTVRIQGDLYVNGISNAQDHASRSDERLKTDIQNLSDQQCLELTMMLQTVTYCMNDREQIGFIAQQVQKILPQVVFVDVDGFLSLDYGKISALYAGAITRLYGLIFELKSEIENLKHGQL